MAMIVARSLEELVEEQQRVQCALRSLSGEAWALVLPQEARTGIAGVGTLPRL